ncbi:MAG: DivIVA domain-containing protein [Ilumatobacteraceae bacterium]|nr:DivIVA domain-containing protein [Ilumatobacteraceae bacterium]
MELSPAQITEASFRTIRKGYDPDEVDAFLAEVAKALESSRQQATAMEARARAAVARLQEVTAAAAAEPAPAPPEPAPAPPPEPVEAPTVQLPAAESEAISRTLFLAQRTADSTVAEARSEAERILGEATSEAEATIDSTREMSAQMIEEARAEARSASEAERVAAANEVEALVARREFLVGDVDQLERFLIDQRDRLRGAARQIEALCERVPEGLGSVRPPALSASDDHEQGDPTEEMQRPSPDDDQDDDSSSRTDGEIDPTAR